MGHWQLVQGLDSEWPGIWSAECYGSKNENRPKSPNPRKVSPTTYRKTMQQNGWFCHFFQWVRIHEFPSFVFTFGLNFVKKGQGKSGRSWMKADGPNDGNWTVLGWKRRKANGPKGQKVNGPQRWTVQKDGIAHFPHFGPCTFTPAR